MANAIATALAAELPNIVSQGSRPGSGATGNERIRRTLISDARSGNISSGGRRQLAQMERERSTPAGQRALAALGGGGRVARRPGAARRAAPAPAAAATRVARRPTAARRATGR
jgi:hypothetical protein